MKISRRAWLTGLVASPLAGAAAAYLNTPRAAAPPDRALADLSPRERARRRRLPNVELITHEGKRVRFYDDLVRDRKVAINMLYTNCGGICSPATRNIRVAKESLGERVGKDVFFYSITLKPEEDTPEVLADYARRNRTGAGWTFLTGSPEATETLRRALGFSHSTPEWDADPSSHLGSLRLIVEPLARWGHTNTMSPPAHIARSIRFEFDSPTVRMYS